jgi:CHASE2 domain-containing sensor protein
MKLFTRYIKHLIFISTVGYFLIFKFLHFVEEINPVKKELSDFRFTDIYFGHFKEQKKDNDIILVDIEMKKNSITRGEVTSFIKHVNKKYKPRAIVVDLNFSRDSNVNDSININLANALENDNVLMPYSLKKFDGRWEQAKSEIPINYNLIDEGFTNNLVEKDKFGVMRFFKPILVQELDTMKHLSLLVSEKFGKPINESLKEDKKVMINFSYKYNEPINILDTLNYSFCKDKIVIIGVFSKDKYGLPLYNDDIHYTSANKAYLGKSFPNMYGGEVLATIISNIKNNSFIEYIKDLSLYINIILSLMMYYFLLFAKTVYHELYGTIEIIIKFVVVTIFILVSIFFVSYSNLYIDLTTVGLVSFFAVEFVGPIDHTIDYLEEKIKTLISFKNA